MDFRKNLIIVLLTFSFLLVVANIVIDNLKKEEPVEKDPTITITLLENRLSEALTNYGIKDNWISGKEYKKPQYDSLKHYFNITLPGDLPHLEVIREFFSLNTEKEIKIHSEEEILNKRTRVTVYTENTPKLEAVFTTVQDSLRNYPVLTFLITDINRIDEQQRIEILEMPYPSGICIVPSPDGDSLLVKADMYKKPFYVLISDNMEEQYLIEPGNSKESLNDAIGNIQKKYRDAAGFLIDNKSDLFNSAIFSFLRDKFAANNTPLYNIAGFKTLNSDNIDDLLSRVYFYARSSSPGEKKLFLIPADKFYKIREDINRLKKFGYKLEVHSPGEYL